jgi:hypothetical protein
MAGYIIGPCGVAPAASAGSFFAPAGLSNVSGWYKADAGTFQDTGRTTAATITGDAVKGITDQSGHGNHLASGATTVATLTTSSLNSLPTITLNGAGTQGLQAAVTLTSRTLLSVAGIWRFTSSPDFGRYFSLVGNGQTADFNNLNSVAINRNNNATNIAGLINSNGFNAAAVSLNTYCQILVVYNGTSLDCYVNGVFVGNGSTFGGTPALGDASSLASIAVGMVANAGGTPLTGDFAEVFWDSADWGSNLSAIHTYLNGRWGV